MLILCSGAAKKKSEMVKSKALCFTCTGCTGYWGLTTNTTTVVLHFLFSLVTMGSFQALSGNQLLLGCKEINKVIMLATFSSPHRLCSHRINKWLAPQSAASGHCVLQCAKHVCGRTYCCNTSVHTLLYCIDQDVLMNILRTSCHLITAFTIKVFKPASLY